MKINNKRIKSLIRETILEQMSSDDKVQIAHSKQDYFESKGCKTEKSEDGLLYMYKSTCQNLEEPNKITESKKLRFLFEDASANLPDCPGNADCQQIGRGKVAQYEAISGCKVGKGTDELFYIKKSTCTGNNNTTSGTPDNNGVDMTKWEKIAKDKFEELKKKGKQIGSDIIEKGGEFFQKIISAVTPDFGNGGGGQNNNSAEANFPACVKALGPPNIATNVAYTKDGEASFNTNDGTTFLLNQNGSYISANSSGQKQKGTWSCVSDTEFTYTSQQISNSTVDDVVTGAFPDCVTGLQKRNDPNRGDYYYGTASDTANNQYGVAYYSTSKTGSDGTKGYEAIILAPGYTKGYPAVYFCMGDYIVINSWDGNIKLKSQSSVGAQNLDVSLDEINDYNVGGLALYIGDSNALSTRSIDSAVTTMIQYVEKYYRSNYFKWFREMIVHMRDYATAQNKPRDVKFLTDKLTQIDDSIKKVTSNIQASKADIVWDVLSSPVGNDIGLYYQKDLKGTFPWENSQQPVIVYQFKSQLTSRANIQAKDAKLKEYMAGNSFDETFCNEQLETLIQYAGQPQLVKGMQMTTNLTDFSTDDIKPMKMVVTKCRTSHLYDRNMKKYGKALNYLTTAEPKYQINYGALCTDMQPPNPAKECPQ